MSQRLKQPELLSETCYNSLAFLIPPAVLRAAWLTKAFGATSYAGIRGFGASLIHLSVMISFVVGIVIVVTLAVRAGANESIARALYDVELPEKTT